MMIMKIELAQDFGTYCIVQSSQITVGKINKTNLIGSVFFIPGKAFGVLAMLFQVNSILKLNPPMPMMSL